MFGTRFGIEFFRDGLDHAGIYHVTERWGCWPLHHREDPELAQLDSGLHYEK